MDTDKRFCSIIFDVLAGHGVTDIVCSPGSRNTPLLIAAAARTELCKHVVIDERSAAFMALGLAVVSRRPVALVCTSGTALLNYAPAIAEAFYQSVPLIVISADRPEQWIDQDDSQTLRQFEAFSNYVKRSYQLPAFGDEDKEMQWYANRIANDAMIEALSRRKGPVHINIQLGEPLNRRRPLSTEPPRLIHLTEGDSIGNKEVIRELAGEIAQKKVMFVAGFLPPDSRMHRAVGEFCSRGNIVAMTETISNLHLKGYATSIDKVLTALEPGQLDELAPELVISIGGSLVSRKLKEYLRRHAATCEHWAIGWNHTTSDCFMSLTRRIEADPGRLLHQLAAALRKLPTPHNEYFNSWRSHRFDTELRFKQFVRSAPWSDFMAYYHIFQFLSNFQANVFLSNGTTVRYAQLFGEPAPHASFCNRGVSGIDGSISTAVGGAKAYKGLTVMITGDMSMAYDVNALALPDIPDRMRIIVIDNSGGGIFRFIPSTANLEEREQYFCAPPRLPLRQLAEGYGWDYYEATDADSLANGLIPLLMEDKKGILRVVTPPEESATLLRELLGGKLKK